MLRCFAPPELGISSNRFSNQSTNLLKIVKTEHVKAFFFLFHLIELTQKKYIDKFVHFSGMIFLLCLFRPGYIYSWPF